MKELLETVHPNVKDQDGKTALMWAADNGYEATTRLLLANGADIYIESHNKKTENSYGFIH